MNYVMWLKSGQSSRNLGGRCDTVSVESNIIDSSDGESKTVEVLMACGHNEV